MIGFIKKDLLMIKSNFKLLGILIIVYAIMGLMGEIDVSFILPFMSVMVMISTFSYDAYNNWDAYSISFPDGRKNNVKGKYIATILMTIIVTIITLLLSFIISYVNTKTINFEETLVSMFGSLFGTLLVLSFTYPIIYKLGVEKARIAIFLIVFGFIFLITLLSSYINIEFIAKSLSFLENYLIIILTLIMIIMVYISYKISEKIFSKKEF